MKSATFNFMGDANLRKYRMHQLALIIIFCLSFSIALAGDEPDSLLVDRDIKTPEAATDKALEYLGFLEMDGFSIEKNYDKAEIVRVDNDKTPFLHQHINNRDIWKVTFKSITLMPYRGYPDSVDYPRAFDVYIDPDDGTLLKIESLYAGNNIDFAPEPSIEWAESRLEGSQHKFLGFASPDSDYVSLYDVLNSLGPSNFKQLKALLVLNPRRQSENPIAVWFVIYRGTDPYLPMSRGADLSKNEAYNYKSFIYDAKTGKTMGWTVKPSVEPDWDKK